MLIGDDNDLLNDMEEEIQMIEQPRKKEQPVIPAKQPRKTAPVTTFKAQKKSDT